MSKTVVEHGGLIDKFIGDGIMAVFGLGETATVEEHVHQAVTCSQAMLATIEELNKNWHKKSIPQFSIRVGIHSGPAVVGAFGSDIMTDYTVIGPTVNVAARIERVCDADCIFFSEVVRDYLANGSFRWEVAGDFNLKGLSGTTSLFKISKTKKAA